MNTNLAKPVRYTGLIIYRTEDGYCAQNGPDYAADNEPTIEDAKAAIDNYWITPGDNALRWRESTLGLKAGTYAWAGGKWHNVKDLDPGFLAHI